MVRIMYRHGNWITKTWDMTKWFRIRDKEVLTSKVEMLFISKDIIKMLMEAMIILMTFILINIFMVWMICQIIISLNKIKEISLYMPNRTMSILTILSTMMLLKQSRMMDSPEKKKCLVNNLKENFVIQYHCQNKPLL